MRSQPGCRGNRALRWVIFLLVLPLWILAMMLCDPAPVWAFTQGAGIEGIGIIPQGHEWLTVRSALELLGDQSGTEPTDPRVVNQLPRAERTQLTPESIKTFKQERVSEQRYGAQYRPVLDAVLGERWVDIGGFNVAKSKLSKINCFNAVAQLPDDIQHDHFCRMRNDVGGQGAIDAITDSQARFIQYFVDAAIAAPGNLKAYDGGGFSEAITVNRNYFLLGRAIHLFEDSFSSDHAVRLPADGYKKVHGIKTYLCTLKSDQHGHELPLAINPKADYREIGDVIWQSRDLTWQPSNAKLNALVAVEGTKDVWAAFIRVMAAPTEQRASLAQTEAQAIAQTWLSFDPAEVKQRYDDPDAAQKIPTFVTDQAACDRTIADVVGGTNIMETINKNRAICVYNIEPQSGLTERDRHLHIPYYWQWKSLLRFLTPPVGYDPTSRL